MKKTAFRLVLLLVVLALVFTALFSWRPELARVLRYQNPDGETYKIFPQTVVRPADTAFHFIRNPENRTDLDTLRVLDSKNKLVPFKTYFDEGRISVFMVIRNDSIIYERTAPGYSDTTLTTLFSVGKSMTSMMLGKALEEGKIKSLDDLLTTYVPELKSNPAFDHITLMHLLSMKSGLEFRDLSNPLMSVFSDEAKYYYTDDIKKQLLKTKLAHQPGTFWQYRSIDVFLLSWALENATGQKTAQYFQDKIWKNIGTEYAASWGLDHQNGFANTASRFQATAIDMAKIGRLYLKKGNYNGHQVIPEEWVNSTTHLNGALPETSKYWQKTTFHYLWWVPQLPVSGDYSAEGTRGQRIYVDPLTNTVIVQFAAKGGGDYPYRKISRYLSGLPFAYPKER